LNINLDYINKKVDQWRKYADEDLRIAEHAFTIESAVPYRLIAYHAQQCAEKYLKAFLVKNLIDFPYTHNISKLLELSSSAAIWPTEINDAEELTPFAITARYPGEEDEVTESDARRAVELAKLVKRNISVQL